MQQTAGEPGGRTARERTTQSQTIAHGPGMAIAMDARTAMGLVNGILYLAGARYQRDNEIPMICSPIVIGDKYPPMSFAIEADQEKPVNYIIEVAAAGLDRNDLSVVVDKYERIITIEHDPPKEVTEKQLGPDGTRMRYLSEGIARRAFRRGIVAPDKSDLEKVSIECKDGILRVRIPILEQDPNKITLKLQ